MQLQCFPEEYNQNWVGGCDLGMVNGYITVLLLLMYALLSALAATDLQGLQS